MGCVRCIANGIPCKPSIMPCDLFIMDRRRSVVRRVNYGQKEMMERVRVQMHDFNMECMCSIGTMGVRSKCQAKSCFLESI